MLTHIFYRISQFWQSFFAKPLSNEDWGTVTSILSEPEVELFKRFQYHDQQHSYRVLALLVSQGYDDQVLLKAALLHDVGKTKVPFTMFDRVLVVLGFRLFPEKAENWANGEAQGWSRPFVVKAKHPEWGAEMVTAVGSDALTISLIQKHQDKLDGAKDDEEAARLRILQWADDQA